MASNPVKCWTYAKLGFIGPKTDLGLIMTLDEKIRYGMIALGGASIVFATLGIHVNPLEIAGGSGMG